MTEEIMMVPHQEFERLTDYYKGQLTESTLINKAARFATKKHVLVRDKRIPYAIIL